MRCRRCTRYVLTTPKAALRHDSQGTGEGRNQPGAVHVAIRAGQDGGVHLGPVAQLGIGLGRNGSQYEAFVKQLMIEISRVRAAFRFEHADVRVRR